jgi:hypothetical protein
MRATEYGPRISVRIPQVCVDVIPGLILLHRRNMISLLVRLATRLRLHRDPAELGYLPSESEDRRRLWWNIVELDVRMLAVQWVTCLLNTLQYLGTNGRTVRLRAHYSCDTNGHKDPIDGH